LLNAAEFFCVGENEIHVFVEGEHLAGELAAVFEGGAHAEVDLGFISFRSNPPAVFADEDVYGVLIHNLSTQDR
jgi:hypothetical protein